MILRLAFLAAVISVAGCASEPIYLRHPETGQRVQCGPFPELTREQKLTAPVREERCISDFQRQGYERIARPQ